MKNADNTRPFSSEAQFVEAEPLLEHILQTAELKKAGPVRALPISYINWARLEAIHPYPESPIHD